MIRYRAWLMRGVALLAGLAATVVSAAPTVDIARIPLYGRNQNIHPNLLLSLSVEFPTVGAAYRGDYDGSTEYVGYFNPGKCYTYNNTENYFEISGNATAARTCSGAFSGNFMNWATSSAIDMLRLALTGGDRVVDETTRTVLQRAVLPDDFFNSGSYFPRRQLSGSSLIRGVTPFTNSTVYVTSCGNKLFFGSSTSNDASCSNPRNYQNLNPGSNNNRRPYLVRVKVCDANESATRTDLCQNYNGNFKPVGEMQRNATRVRFGAFGYLNDSASSRNGGVLRAPLKYVGATSVDANFDLIANTARQEWDPATGVFRANPENAAEGVSGVINYLNQFGRSGQYKELDPVSELYYESIRYLQGRQPTPSAVSGITAAFKDGFPAYTTWTDPVLASCQRNYVLAIADINTHWDRFVPGNTRTYTDSARAVESFDNFDVMEWTRKVGDLESQTAGGNPNRDTALANLQTLDTGSGDHGTYYMAGTAYWAATSAFRPNMPNLRVTTFSIDVDEGGDGTVTTAKRRSQLYLAAKYGGFNDRNNDGNPFRTYAADGRTVVTNNSEWEDAPGSRVPSNWFLAGQPAKMIAAIRNIFNRIVSFGGTISGVAVTSTKVGIGGAFQYSPGFDALRWSGRLAAHRITKDANDNLTLNDTSTWEAGALLNQQTPASRRIFSYRRGTAGGNGITFDWTSLSTTQQGWLNRNPDSPTQAADGQGQNRLAYLRGDTTREQRNNGAFRSRDTLLGDIVNSGPVYVGAPKRISFESAFNTFYTDNLNRTKAVYVGANDGMLHAFHGDTGAELFAYVPNAVMQNLPDLTSPSYTHRAYVDATPVISEAVIGSAWTTVLASGMGGGAQGVFALNVTNPAAFGTGNVLWEFTDEDDPDMGNVMGVPQIVKLKTGVVNGVSQYRWFVMTGNGLNSNLNDGTGRFNANAPAVLFLLSLDKPANQRWTLNTNYYKFVMPASDATLANGLGSPAVALNNDGQALTAYAGDLQGNLWKFMLSDGPAAANVLPTYKDDTTAQPLFTATDGAGRRQPITMQPQVVFARGGYMVLFGTGKYYEASDSRPAAQANSFYGIYDANITPRVRVTGRNRLNAIALTADGSSYRFSRTPFALGTGSTQKMGWYFDFPDSSERQVTDALLSNGTVYFNSLLTGTDLCGTGSGSRNYAVNALTGLPVLSNTGYLSPTGMLGAPVIIELRVDKGVRDSVGLIDVTRTVEIWAFGATGGGKQAFVGEGGNAAPGTPGEKPPAGRFSWREIRNMNFITNTP